VLAPPSRLAQGKQTLQSIKTEGGAMLNQLSLVGLAQAAVNSPIDGWSLSRSLVMSGVCLLVLLIASRTINQPKVGPKMPLGPLGPLFNNISLAGFLGSMSLGHILGAFLIINFVH
jgi:photosystem I subunit X